MNIFRLSLKDFFIFNEQIADFHDCKGLYEKINQTYLLLMKKILWSWHAASYPF